jgi:hypothetical protein
VEQAADAADLDKASIYDPLIVRADVHRRCRRIHPDPRLSRRLGCAPQTAHHHAEKSNIVLRHHARA